jgi:mono/diheme cytochrome c family protein
LAAGADGAALFAQHCASCHQADGSGTVGLAPALKGEHWMRLGADRVYLPMVVVHGLAGPIKVGAQNFVGAMPGLGAQLDDAAIAAIATHVRRLQVASDDKPFSAEEVKAVRAAAGSPPQARQRRVQLLGS